MRISDWSSDVCSSDLFEVQQKIVDAYARYGFAEIVQALLNFCSVDPGSLYLDVTKDRLYTMGEDSRGRRSAQSALYRIAEAFRRWSSEERRGGKGCGSTYSCRGSTYA